MRLRNLVTGSAVVVLLGVAGLALPSNCLAQVSDPTAPGHGSCIQTPYLQSVQPMSGFSFDAFLLDRASRLVMAATQWQSPEVARASTWVRTRPMVVRPSAKR